MENLPKKENQLNKGTIYKTLKENLLNGNSSLEETKGKLIELDQETSSRDASEMNLVFLKDPEVFEFVSKNTEAVEGYNRLLSFTEFHVAQRLAFDNDENSLNHFQNALDSARLNTSNESWKAYIEGTLLYMQGKEIPEDLICKVEEKRNTEILRDLNQGLKERGVPLYKEDYGK